MKTRKLYLMVGIAGSGKSTWIKKQDMTFAFHVSRDDIRFAKVNESEDYFAKEDEVFNEYCSRINYYLSNGFNVYADATHLTGKSRNKLLNNITFDLNNVSITVVFFNTPLEVAIERNNQREGRAKVPENVIRNQYEHLVKPTHNEKYKYDYIMEVT